MGSESLDCLAQTVRMAAPIQVVYTPPKRPIDVARTQTGAAAGGQTEAAYLLQTRSDHGSPRHKEWLSTLPVNVQDSAAEAGVTFQAANLCRGKGQAGVNWI